MAKIEAVLFDFGGTLYQYQPGGPVAEDGLLVELARAAGADTTPEEVRAAYRTAMRRVYADYLQRPYYLHRDFFGDAVRATIEEVGGQPADEHIERYHAARDAARGERPDVSLRPGVHDTLATLRERGITVGIVSNTDEAGFRDTMREAGLEDVMDFIISSEQCQSCKPDQGIFREALRRAGSDPAATLFVGDSIDQDIAGANRAGLISVLLWTRDDRQPPDREPRPSHVINTVPEVLDLVG
jgi:putative hydrolase of the HAD superfamily